MWPISSRIVVAVGIACGLGTIHGSAGWLQGSTDFCQTVTTIEQAASANFTSVRGAQLATGLVPLEGTHYRSTLQLPNAKYCEVINSTSGATWTLECHWEYAFQDEALAQQEFRGMVSGLQKCLTSADTNAPDVSEHGAIWFKKPNFFLDVAVVTDTYLSDGGKGHRVLISVARQR